MSTGPRYPPGPRYFRSFAGTVIGVSTRRSRFVSQAVDSSSILHSEAPLFQVLNQASPLTISTVYGMKSFFSKHTSASVSANGSGATTPTQESSQRKSFGKDSVSQRSSNEERRDGQRSGNNTPRPSIFDGRYRCPAGLDSCADDHRFPALQHMQVTPTSTPRGTQSEGSNATPSAIPIGPPKGRLVVNIIAGRNLHTPSHEVSPCTKRSISQLTLISVSPMPFVPMSQTSSSRKALYNRATRYLA